MNPSTPLKSASGDWENKIRCCVGIVKPKENLASLFTNIRPLSTHFENVISEFHKLFQMAFVPFCDKTPQLWNEKDFNGYRKNIIRAFISLLSPYIIPEAEMCKSISKQSQFGNKLEASKKGDGPQKRREWNRSVYHPTRYPLSTQLCCYGGTIWVIHMLSIGMKIKEF